jgi:hypothetical protein
MNRILIYLLSKTSFGKLLDGKKTLIGAVLIIVVSALDALDKLAPMFPQYPILKDAAGGILAALKAAQPFLENLGVGFLTVGVLHKGVKAKLPDAK